MLRPSPPQAEVTVRQGSVLPLARPAGTEALDGRAVLATLLRHESASAQALARLGLMEPAAAQSISNTCKPELFSIDLVLRDTLQHELTSGATVPPLMQALRETVQLFNPQAARQVFKGGQLQAAQHNALVCITQDLIHQLVRQLPAALQALASQGQAARSLEASMQRVIDAGQRALRLQWAVDPALIQDHADLYLECLAEGLHLPAVAALPGTAPHDDWASLGSEFGLLLMCTGRVSAQLDWPSSQARMTQLGKSQVQRAPLLVAQWMDEICSLDALACETPSFWHQRLPLWAQLAGQAAQGLQQLATRR